MFVYKSLRQLGILLTKIFLPTEIIGLENIPSEGGAIICYNHILGRDVIILTSMIKRPLVYVAKKELFRIPVVNLVLKSFDAIPVARGTADMKMMHDAVHKLKDGKIVALSPYGTRTYKKDISQIRIRGGAVLMAIDSGTPIIPLTIVGNYKIFHKMTMIVGKPRQYNYNPEENPEMKKTEFATEKAVELMHEIESVHKEYEYRMRKST